MTAVVRVTRERIYEVAFENPGTQVEDPPGKPATCVVDGLLYIAKPERVTA